MKSIRDIVNRMPATRSQLEDAVLGYSPAIKDALDRNPAYRAVISAESERTFDKYGTYLGGLTQKLSAAGHTAGYAADAWLVTGDIVGSLGGKFINLLAQVPEKAYSIAYGVKTGNYLDSLQNIFEGVLSYLPGLTVVDQGLSRIVQKRMIKDAVYNIEERLGIEHTSWYKRAARKMDLAYTDVEDRSANIVRPSVPALA
ncbi:MAG TPA: hypothetical protein VJK51_01715 [Candidatus Nanoarchaeia archaeon]|nr:hypothetical protein [Candidatus Nanoarchaeia archaeon]